MGIRHFGDEIWSVYVKLQKIYKKFGLKASFSSIVVY